MQIHKKAIDNQLRGAIIFLAINIICPEQMISRPGYQRFSKGKQQILNKKMPLPPAGPLRKDCPLSTKEQDLLSAVLHVIISHECAIVCNSE